ncbi:hypothetical protein pb186bvf_009360 [Paramecium bursaria]
MNKLLFMKRTQTASGGLRIGIEQDKMAQTFTQITLLQDNEQKLQKQMRVLEKKREELDEEIKKKESDIKERRRLIIERQKEKPIISEEKSKDEIKKDFRQVDNIQFNIDYLKQKENEYIAQRAQIKKEIDKMRKEKLMFQHILSKMQQELQNKKQEVEEKKEQQSSALQSYKSQILDLQRQKMQSVQEQKRFNSEYKNVFDKFFKDNRKQQVQRSPEPSPKLSKSKDQSKKQKGYRPQMSPLTQQSQQRLQLPDEDLEFYESEIEKLNLDLYDRSPNQKKKQQQQKERQAQQKDQKESKILEELQHKLDLYNSTQRDLIDQTKANDFNGVVDTFLQYQEDNYRQFKFINELSDDLETIQKLNKLLKDELQDLEDKPKRLQEDPKYREWELINKKIQDIKQNREKLHEKYLELSKILKELKISIPNMFDRIGCNQKEYLSLLGQNFSFRDMDEDKIIKVLGVIEIRTNDILQMQNIANNPRIIKDSGIQNRQDDIPQFQDGAAQQLSEEQLTKLITPLNQVFGKEGVQDKMQEQDFKNFADAQLKDRKKDNTTKKKK